MTSSKKSEVDGEALKAAPDRHYQERLVAFIDIIGFKSIIDRTVVDPTYLESIIAAISEIRDQFINDRNTALQKMIRDQLFPDEFETHVIQVSDCMVISKLAHPPGALQSLVIDIALAIHILISHGLLCRGRIERGKVFHSEEYIIGPAYIAAYLAESAEFVPAVTLSADLQEFGARNQPDNPKLEEYFNHFVIPHIKNTYFIDYFNDLEGFIDMLEDPIQHYAGLRDIIEREYNNASDYRVKAKYLWMIDRFNESRIVKDRRLRKLRK